MVVCTLDDLDSVVTILVYHLPSIFLTISRLLDSAVFPLYYFFLYHLVFHGAWVPALSLVGGFWLPFIPKYWISRQRPAAVLGWECHAGKFSGADNYSMPSGHATFLACAMSNLLWVKGADLWPCGSRLFYGPIFFWFFGASMARVIMGAHWFGDVLAGWLTGFSWFWFWSWCSSAILATVTFVTNPL